MFVGVSVGSCVSAGVLKVEVVGTSCACERVGVRLSVCDSPPPRLPSPFSLSVFVLLLRFLPFHCFLVLWFGYFYCFLLFPEPT